MLNFQPQLLQLTAFKHNQQSLNINSNRFTMFPLLTVP